MDHVSAARARIADIQARFGMVPTPRDTPRPHAFAREMLRATVAHDPRAPETAAHMSEPGAFDDLIRTSAARHGVDAGLVRAVIRAESGFDPEAVSRAGARGLMQLMPETGRALGVTDPFNPAQNIDGGVRYLRSMLDRFDSPTLAIAAYNAGPGNVERYGGVPPFAETQAYVKRVEDYLAQER